MSEPSMTEPPFLPPMSVLETVMRDPRKLKPNPKNPRSHSPEQLRLIRGGIEQFGSYGPLCVVDARNNILIGHGRHAAALLDYVDDGGKHHAPLAEIPVTVFSGSKTDAAALALYDNRIAETSVWDRDLLRDALLAIQGKVDLGSLGFDAASLPQFLADRNSGLADPDAAPEAKPDPIVRPGDLWCLGRHRILCGDSTSSADVGRLLDGAKPALMVTDPPYGVEYDPNWRNQVIRANGSKVAARAIGEVHNDDRADWSEAWKLFPGAVAYVWHGALHSPTVAASLEACGFKIRAQIVWIKARFAIGRGHYHWQHEPSFYVTREGQPDGWQDRFEEEHSVAEYAVREGKTGNWSGGRKQSTVWEIDHIKNETGHSTQKPVECMKRPMENNSRPGDAIYEPFSGSGSTIIAAEMSGRHVYAMEISPAYVQVAIERWQTFTGKSALLDGKTFSEVAKARLASTDGDSSAKDSSDRKPVPGKGTRARPAVQ